MHFDFKKKVLVGVIPVTPVGIQGILRFWIAGTGFQSMSVALGFWIPEKVLVGVIPVTPVGIQGILRFWIAGTGFQSMSVALGFWIPVVSGIPDP